MQDFTFPPAIPYPGVDRAQPVTAAELETWLLNTSADPMQQRLVVGYYLPSPYASVSWAIDVADVLAGNAKVYPLPIYVADLTLEQGDGTDYASEAIALCRVYPNHGVVALDIEEESESTTPTAIAAIDIQEQIAREFITKVVASSELVPVVYCSPALYDRLLSNVWVASWIPLQAYPVGGPYMPDVATYQATVNGSVLQDIPKPLGWQYSGDDMSPWLAPDLSLWLPFLFTEPDNFSPEWSNMQKHTTKEGDTLDSIATELYGKAGAVVQAIFQTNIRKLRSYGPRGEIPAGTVLTVPDRTTPTDTATVAVDTQAAYVPTEVGAEPVVQDVAPVAYTTAPGAYGAAATSTVAGRVAELRAKGVAPAVAQAQAEAESARAVPAAAPTPVAPTPVTPTPVGATPTAPADWEQRLKALVEGYGKALEVELDSYLAAHKATILATATKVLAELVGKL